MTLERRINRLRDAMHRKMAPPSVDWPPPPGAHCDCLICETIGQYSEIVGHELIYDAMLAEYELTPETKRN